MMQIRTPEAPHEARRLRRPPLESRARALADSKPEEERARKTNAAFVLLQVGVRGTTNQEGLGA
eukprot:12449631-Alexandrium_andersonii.AAC.1